MAEEFPDEEHKIRILDTKWVTHNVRRFTLERPEGYHFVPGQATDIVINKSEWKEERRPFTFTGLNDWDHLEFTIKIYTDHDGVTNQLGKLENNDELLIHDAFGAIHYKGPGVFIAGGAGVTPFIAIFRQLHKDGKLAGNTLLFSNNTTRDIILKDEFEKILGDHFINTLTKEKKEPYDYGFINKEYLTAKVKNLDQYFYICGPDKMLDDTRANLKAIGVADDKIVAEEF